MAPRESVRSLKDLCLPIVFDLIQDIVDYHSQKKNFKKNKMANDLKKLLNKVPPNFHDLLFDWHLREVKRLIGPWTWDLRGKEKYFSRLMSVVTILKVKTLNISNRPAYMKRKLLHLLVKMKSLEVFSCPEHWTTDLERGRIKRYRFAEYGNLQKALPALSNLTSFTFREFCTDKIIRAVCKNCKALRVIDVEGLETEQARITDISIKSLIKCKSLKSVNLLHTAVSADGFLTLLLETKSSLFKICGLEGSLHEVLDKMEAQSKDINVRKPETELKTEPKTRKRAEFPPETPRTFHVPELKCFNPTEKHLHLLVKYFPHLTKVLFAYKSAALHHDFSVLSELKQLQRVEFEFDNCALTDVSEILSKCPSVVSVSLSPNSVSILSSWLEDVSQLCPRIEKLTVCEPSRTYSWRAGVPELHCAPKSFQNLTELVWTDFTLPWLHQIFCQAKNLQVLKLSDPYVKLRDECFEWLFLPFKFAELTDSESAIFRPLEFAEL